MAWKSGWVQTVHLHRRISGFQFSVKVLKALGGQRSAFSPKEPKEKQSLWIQLY